MRALALTVLVVYMLRAFTLVLVLYCACPSVTEENSQKQPDDLGAQFTDIFIKESENVTLILSLLEVSFIFSSEEMQINYWAFVGLSHCTNLNGQ